MLIKKHTLHKRISKMYNKTHQRFFSFLTNCIFLTNLFCIRDKSIFSFLQPLAKYIFSKLWKLKFNKLKFKKEINLAQPKRNPVKNISVQHIFLENLLVTYAWRARYRYPYVSIIKRSLFTVLAMITYTRTQSLKCLADFFLSGYLSLWLWYVCIIIRERL